MSHSFPEGLSQAEVIAAAETFVPLSSLKSNYLDHLLTEHACVEHLFPGQVIFERGDSDCRHVYLLSGRIVLEYASGLKKSLDAIGSLFPIVNEMPRPCRAYAESDCTVIFIDSDRLDRILSWSQIAQYLLSEFSLKREFDEDLPWIQTILNSNLFYKVPPVNAEQIVGRMTVQEVVKGEVILRQGELGDCCYFIKEGQASVYRQEGRKPLHLADIQTGRCFGEDALVNETARNATVKMESDGVLMRLSKKDFQLLLLEPKIDEYSEGDQQFDQPPVFIDVRTHEEYEQGHLTMAINLPLAFLSVEKRMLDMSVPYVVYCDTGRRSRSAAYLLARLGFTVSSLAGGLLGAGMQYQLVQDFSYLLKGGKVVRASIQ